MKVKFAYYKARKWFWQVHRFRTIDGKLRSIFLDLGPLLVMVEPRGR